MGAFFLYLFWVTNTVILQLDWPFSISISSGEFLPFNLRIFYGLISGWFAAFQNFIKFEFSMFIYLFFWTRFLRRVDFSLVHFFLNLFNSAWSCVNWTHFGVFNIGADLVKIFISLFFTRFYSLTCVKTCWLCCWGFAYLSRGSQISGTNQLTMLH